MACTTILVGKKASFDGSTMIARNEDQGNGTFMAKNFIAIPADQQVRDYTSVLSHVHIQLPDDPLDYEAIPNANPKEGNWSSAGINAAGVGMSATETLTTNERVQGLDPLVDYQPARGNEGDADYAPEVPGGIGEEDMVTIVLPYIHSAREGVQRLGSLLEEYGTYEMNGIGFNDVNEIWWLETIGGHHWMARRVPDDAYVTMPNQLGLDTFDFDDAYGDQHDFMCSADLREFVEKNHLDLSMDGKINPRDAFGSHSDTDHVYNTPRAWEMQRWLNPHAEAWDDKLSGLQPTSDDIPWCRVPERKITVEDVKYVLSMHYQETEYDPYSGFGPNKGKYRPIGINRTSQLVLCHIRSDAPEDARGIEWVAMGSNMFNAFAPFYSGVHTTPDYVSNATDTVTTNNFYWANRLVAALADPYLHEGAGAVINRYQQAVGSQGWAIIHETDKQLSVQGLDDEARRQIKEAANQKTADMLRAETDKLLDEVLYIASMNMKSAFSLNDA
ncbi:MAG: C69 family dipeptidase [Actinomycetaceae bacterium]|nr:C69 family dipeptidase [Actinomycetaceae bacterium]MDY6083551.1 C69 family dipeptidase [Actinomycetaceae bacterium]